MIWLAGACVVALWLAWNTRGEPEQHIMRCESCGRFYTAEQYVRMKSFLGGGDPNRCTIPYCTPRVVEPEAELCGGKLVLTR